MKEIIRLFDITFLSQNDISRENHKLDYCTQLIENDENNPRLIKFAHAHLNYNDVAVRNYFPGLLLSNEVVHEILGNLNNVLDQYHIILIVKSNG